MIVLNNKIYLELLDDELQPKKTFLNTDADLLKYCNVLDVGNSVSDIKKDDIVTLYVININFIDSKKGFCSDRDVIFINNRPKEKKVHINNQQKEKYGILYKGTVLASSSNDIKDGDEIYYKHGQSHILPDNTEILSETQIFYKKG